MKPVQEFKEALALGILTRPVLLSPITFLLLGKKGVDVPADFEPSSLLDRLLPTFTAVIADLVAAGAKSITIDEPILVLDLDTKHHALFDKLYRTVRDAFPTLEIMLSTYFGDLGANTDLALSLPVDIIHFDGVRGESALDTVITRLAATTTKLSLGIVDGRNTWKNDINKSIQTVQRVVNVLGKSRVLIAPSCSLLHSPFSLDREVKMDATVKSWLAFAVEKLEEVRIIVAEVNTPGSCEKALKENAACIADRKNSSLTTDPAVRLKLTQIEPSMYHRKSPFATRSKAQQLRLNLPLYPTTTIGSFPQTATVRSMRLKFKNGKITAKEYDAFIRQEIETTVRFQERIGLDVLVHGESERNDMVEFFGENMKGYAFSECGWVQSYGSRCVKPPILYGDVSRPAAMTVELTAYAQSLTDKPMKGMLTGPITMLQWSFVRNDQPRSTTALQIALALRQEVCDLEAAGLPVIQIDEPAIREGLPLRQADAKAYLEWAVNAFKLASSGVRDDTQIHSHFCYSDFNEIFQSLSDLDADCITIESSKSDLKLLNVFKIYGYSRGIGPGLYDIHSPRVPTVEEMAGKLGAMASLIEPKLLWGKRVYTMLCYALIYMP